MSNLDISDRRKPQDGKIIFRNPSSGKNIELRVATIPTAGGVEDVVIRVVASGKPVDIDKLNLSWINNTKLKQLIEKPQGMFLVCGPTGSGKTTMLHSVLDHINQPRTKIWTAEDPVELIHEGLRQVQISQKTGLTFAAAIRSFLRADPDVIMIGEMRDQETVSIGVEASLTGHMVFATMHTNSAAESVTRLLDMGIDPFNIADAMVGVLSQRLIKRLCENCKESYIPNKEGIHLLLSHYSNHIEDDKTNLEHYMQELKQIYQSLLKEFGDGQPQLKLYQSRGCAKCDGTGYKGRIAVHELLEATPGIKRLIQRKAHTEEILSLAKTEGMRTIKQDAIEKALSGLIDIKQLRLLT